MVEKQVPVSAVLLLLLVVDVGQVVGAGQEEGVVEGVVPVLGRGDQVLCRGLVTCIFRGCRCSHLYPGDVCTHVEEPPDQLAQRGPQHGVPHPGLALGHAEHALVRGAEGHQVPGKRRVIYKI